MLSGKLSAAIAVMLFISLIADHLFLPIYTENAPQLSAVIMSLGAMPGCPVRRDVPYSVFRYSISCQRSVSLKPRPITPGG